MKSKFSFIVPVFNAEHYLMRCVESIKAQTIDDWELILVNDGSTDDSGRIIDALALNDSRIISINQKNAGAGEARNTGIENAHGEWIIFVDSDDYISPDYLALLEKNGNGKDLVFIDLERVDEGGTSLGRQSMSIYADLQKEDILRQQLTGKINWGGVRKCLKSKIIRDGNLRYSNLKNGEEALFSFRALEKAESFGFISEKPIYFYVERDESLSKAKIDDPWGDAVKLIKNFTISDGSYAHWANTINAFAISALVVSIDRITKQYKGRNRKEKLKKRYQDFLEVYDKQYKIDTRHMVYKASVFVPFLKHGILWPVELASTLRNF